MGNPKIWYYPAQRLHTIDFGDVLWTSLERLPYRRGASTTSQTGRMSRVLFDGAMRIRWVVENISATTDAALIRELESLQSHLHNGGSIVLAADSAVAWVRFTTGAVPSGSGTLNHQGPALSFLATDPAADDEFWLHGAWPEVKREKHLAASVATSSAITLTENTRYDYSAGGVPCLIHERHTWPMMKLPAGSMDRPILSTADDVSYTLDVVLQMDTAGVWSFSGEAVALNDANLEDNYTIDEHAGDWYRANAIRTPGVGFS